MNAQCVMSELKNKINKIIFFLMLTALNSCAPKGTFDGVSDLPPEGWSDNNEITFDYSILDSSVPYDFILKTRYNNEYNFHNFYIQYAVCDSAGKELVRKLDQVILFDQKTGKPLGSGFAGTYDLEAGMYYLKSFKFPYTGKFKIKLRQQMRVSPLAGMTAIGIRINEVMETK